MTGTYGQTLLEVGKNPSIFTESDKSKAKFTVNDAQGFTSGEVIIGLEEFPCIELLPSYYSSDLIITPD